MKIIKLKKVHYISYKGITLSKFNPFVEATEDNVAKLKEYIKSGYVEVVDKEQVNEEEIAPASIEIDEEKIEALKEIECIPQSKRGYSEEDLADKTKLELIELLKEEGIEFKPSMKKEELITLLVEM